MYELAPYVFACTTGRNCMFLDLRKDRYLSVPRSRLAGLASEILDWQLPNGLPSHPSPELAAPGLAEELIAAGIICHTDRPRPAPARFLPLAISDLNSCNKVPPVTCGTHSHFRILGSLAWADYMLRYRALFDVIASISAYRSRAASAARENDANFLDALTARFVRVRPWYPRNYLCLFDSLALLRYLAGYGIPAKWVFGVREDPFAAHCWLQHEALVLNEHLERAQQYTPIMAI